MCYSEFNAILKWIAAMDADAFLSRAMAYLRPEGHMDDRTAVVISTFE